MHRIGWKNDDRNGRQWPEVHVADNHETWTLMYYMSESRWTWLLSRYSSRCAHNRAVTFRISLIASMRLAAYTVYRPPTCIRSLDIRVFRPGHFTFVGMVMWLEINYITVRPMQADFKGLSSALRQSSHVAVAARQGPLIAASACRSLLNGWPEASIAHINSKGLIDPVKQQVYDLHVCMYRRVWPLQLDYISAELESH